MFDAIAPRYDLLNRVISLGMDRGWRRAVVAAALAGHPRIVADVGAGTCDLGLEIVRASPAPPRVIALDFSASMLRVGQRRIGANGADGHVWPVAGDALRPPLGAGSVDAVISAFVLRNLDSLAAAWEAFARIIRPGGHLAILEMTPTSRPLFRTLFRLYFHRWVPFVGRRLSGHSSAYTWLPESVDAFPNAEDLAEQLRAAGFVNVRFRRLALGTVAIHEAERPA